jgi:hypothetical protein
MKVSLSAIYEAVVMVTISILPLNQHLFYNHLNSLLTGDVFRAWTCPWICFNACSAKPLYRFDSHAAVLLLVVVPPTHHVQPENESCISMILVRKGRFAIRELSVNRQSDVKSNWRSAKCVNLARTENCSSKSKLVTSNHLIFTQSCE